MDRLIAVLIAAVLIFPCSAAVITVDGAGSGDYQTIQQAINASQDGDTIVVKPGTYAEQVGFSGRKVTVRSEAPDDPAIVAATIIAADSGYSVFFDFGEGATSVLEGFTITTRGVFCAGTAPTISKNRIRDCAGPGVAGESDAAPTIVSNTILSNRQEGIRGCNGLIEGNTISQNGGGLAQCHGTIRDNVISNNSLEGIYVADGTIERNIISRNSAGLAYCNGVIRGNRITDNGDGGGMYFCDAEIVGNVIVGNYASAQGGGLFACNGSITNNIIAGNRADGDGGGLFECDQLISNNTIVGNISATRGGALSQCLGTVRNNIIAYNEATLAGGIFGPSRNSYNAFWTNGGGHFGGGAVSGAGDSVVNPEFVTEGFWQDDAWVDGDYHLRSQAGRWDPARRQWVQDGSTSPCIDAGDPGSSWVTELWPHGRRVNLGAYGATPEASWSTSDVGLLEDLDADGDIGPGDFKRLAEHWLVREDLLAEDLDRNGFVDLNDFLILGSAWRSGPPIPTPPDPNPMTWATEPYGTGPFSVAMVATTATSTDGTGVEYYFENPFSPDMNSGWLTFIAGAEPHWEVTELLPRTAYWFHVKARNRGNLLETDWSEWFSGTTQAEDYAAPTPNPMTWETEPYGSEPGTLRMVATEAKDPSGVEYRFECTSHPEYSSGWQDSRIYEVFSVPPGRYTFTVQARDKSAAQHTTVASMWATADLVAPTPNPMEWEVQPYEVKLGNDLQYGATMIAAEAVDDREDVEYLFQCTTESGFSSGWQSDREYTVLLGRRGQRQRFRVKARDTSTSHNETGWSSEIAAQ